MVCVNLKASILLHMLVKRSTLSVLISQECFSHTSSWDPGYLHFVFVTMLGVPSAWRRQFCGTQWRAVQMLCKWLLLLVTRTLQYWGHSQSKGLPEQCCANAKGWDCVGLHTGQDLPEDWILQKSPLPYTPHLLCCQVAGNMSGFISASGWEGSETVLRAWLLERGSRILIHFWSTWKILVLLPQANTLNCNFLIATLIMRAVYCCLCDTVDLPELVPQLCAFMIATADIY